MSHNLAEVADGLLTHYYDALYDGKASKRAEVSEVVVDMKCETGDARAIAGGAARESSASFHSTRVAASGIGNSRMHLKRRWKAVSVEGGRSGR